MQDPVGYRITGQFSASPCFEGWYALSMLTNEPVIILRFKDLPRDTQTVKNKIREYEQHYRLSDSLVLQTRTSFIHDDYLCIVLNNFDGTPLINFYNKPDLDLVRIIGIIAELAKSVKQLHDGGLIHQNLSPCSIFYSQSSNKIRLTGLGFLSEFPSRNPIINAIESAQGNIAYCSPEQTGNAESIIDCRTDIYSIGIIFYELLTRLVPFHGKDNDEIRYKIIAIAPDSPHSINPAIPKLLSDMVMKLLAKMPEQRYQTVAELQADLANCLNQLRDTTVIKPFALGTSRYSDVAAPGSKLHGRQQQIAELQRSVLEVDNDQNSLLYICGESGVGKTALVSFLEKNLLPANAIVLKSKFDQLEYSAPYVAIVQIVENFANYVLSLSADRIKHWKTIILTELEGQASIICELAPTFERVIGKQPPVLPLGPTETQNRFTEVLLRFFSVISAECRFLVIFFDDIQWADEASIKIFNQLVKSGEIKNGLFIGAYRTGEVESNSIASRTINNHLAEIKSSRRVDLPRLQQEDVDALVQESLAMSPQQSKLISHSVYEKSGGNPFYISQLLPGIALQKDDGEKTPTTDENTEQLDVIELILSRLKKFNREQIEILKYSSLLGSRFESQDLTVVTGINSAVMQQNLRFLDQERLINCDGRYCNFYHDKVQQTIVGLFSNEEFTNFHWNLGSKMLEAFSDEKIDERLYQILSHLNKGINHCKQSSLKNKIIKLNLRASKRAYAECAYRTSQVYATAALELLPSNAWAVNRELAWQIRYELARTGYLLGETNNSLGIIQLLVDKAHDYSEYVKCFALMKDVFANQSLNYPELLQVANAILTKNGIQISLEPMKLAALLTGLRASLDRYFSENEVNEKTICALPVMRNTESKFIVQFCIELWEANYYACRFDLMEFCVLQIVNQSLSKGNALESPIGYVLYAATLCERGEYKKGFELGSSGLKLNKLFGTEILIPKINNLFANYSSFYSQSFSYSAGLYAQSVEVAKKNGDYLFGAWAAFFKVWCLFLAGEKISVVITEYEKLFAFVNQTKDNKMIQAMAMIKHFLNGFKSVPDVNSDMQTRDFENIVNAWNRDAFLAGPVWYRLMQCIWYFSFGRYNEAIAAIDKIDTGLGVGVVMFPFSQLAFYKAMSLLRSPFSLVRREEIDACIQTLKRANDSCPENFYIQYCLLAAESELAESSKKLVLLDSAIEYAEKGESDYSRALCYEQRALLNLTRQNTQEAVQDFSKAIYYYQHWGAEHKANSIKQDYEFLGELDTFETLEQKPVNSASRSVQELFTSISIMQAISSETNLPRLLQKLVELFVKYTYSSKAVLFFYEQEALYSAVSLVEGKTQVYQKNSLLLPESDLAPFRIVKYCAEHRKKISLLNAIEDSDYNNIDYIVQHDVRSLICLPLINHNVVNAVLYLENSSLKGVYKDYNFKSLEPFLSQVSIAIENAKLYDSLKHEIQERQKLNELLKNNATRTRLIHQYSKAGEWEWNIKTDELYWSDEVKQIFGIASDFAIAHISAFNDFVYPDDMDDVKKAINNSLNSGEYYVEHRIKTPDGTIKWLAEAGATIKDESGTPVKMLGIAQDITVRKNAEQEQKQLQSQLLQAQKMEAIGQLTGGVAHDFNNILASVLGFTELAQMQVTGNNSDKLLSYLQQIQLAGEKARDLVSQMLLFSRDQAVDKSVHSLKALINESLALLKTLLPSSVNLSVNTNSFDQNVLINAAQFHQMLMNILINARDAINSKGSVVIETDMFMATGEHCSSCKKSIAGKWVAINITDSGTGILPTVIGRIFEPFFTTKEIGKGTGMGLSMVHGVTHNSGGHILVKSQPGKGSTFSLLLPICKEQSDSLNHDVHTSAQNTKIKKILIVDDEVSILRFISEILLFYGFNTEVKSDSKAALEIIENQGDEFDLVITDQIMPQMTGDVLLKQIRAIRPSMPVIVMSGYNDDIDETNAQAYGFNAYLKKPFEINKLLQLIDQLFSSGTSRSLPK